MNWQVKTARPANGLHIPYVEQGCLDGTPLILLHGVGDSWRSFETTLPHLDESIRVIAFTQRGHGDAEPPDGPWSFATLADDLAAFLDAVGVRRAFIAGHSMGAQVAQRFALNYPHRTQGLALLGGFTTLRGNAEVQSLWDSVLADLRDPVPVEFVRAFQQSTLCGPVDADFFEMVVAESRKLPARVWRSLFAMFLREDFSAELPNIAAPTLVLWGDRDHVCPRADQDRLVTLIPNAWLACFRGAGHGVHWEQPAAVAAALNAFVASGEPTPASGVLMR